MPPFRPFPVDHCCVSTNAQIWVMFALVISPSAPALLPAVEPAAVLPDEPAAEPPVEALPELEPPVLEPVVLPPVLEPLDPLPALPPELDPDVSDPPLDEVPPEEPVEAEPLAPLPEEELLLPPDVLPPDVLPPALPLAEPPASAPELPVEDPVELPPVVDVELPLSAVEAPPLAPADMPAASQSERTCSLSSSERLSHSDANSSLVRRVAPSSEKKAPRISSLQSGDCALMVSAALSEPVVAVPELSVCAHAAEASSDARSVAEVNFSRDIGSLLNVGGRLLTAATPNRRFAAMFREKGDRIGWIASESPKDAAPASDPYRSPSISASLRTRRRKSSSVENSASRYEVTRSFASHAPTIWAPMHMTFTSSCSTD
jgi:hypothetical protein